MKRIQEEKNVVEKMIRLYCRHKHGEKNLCSRCRELLDYAMVRLDHCKFGENKPTCRKCTIHCYKPDMKEDIRIIMRWSGPRMILYHPIDAIKHLIREARLKKQ